MNAADARRYLRGKRYGVLSTLSQHPGITGLPYGSVAPFVADHAACPLFLVSALAEHTKNARADARASFTVFDDPLGGDVQAGARLTLAGTLTPVEEPGPLLDRYLRYLPSAARLVALGDFTLYRLQPQILHFIGGFGAIHWFIADEHALPENALAEAEADILAHMNADHAQALRDYCRHQYGRAATAPVMAGIDGDGFDVRVEDQLLRFVFDPPVADAAGARAALVALAGAARRAAPTSGD
jgi:putative heme iron utilization protein